jgi:transcription elongation factor GreB
VSRAFVKEGDGAEADEPLRRAPRIQPCYITRRGYDAARAAHEALLHEVGGRKLDEVPLDTRDAFRQQSLRLQELTALLQETVPVDPPSGPVAEVRFGATVSLLEPDGRRFELRLVGEDEAAPEQGLLNWRSPLGQRLLGARVGDEVEWQRAASVVWLEVLAVRYD